MWGTSMSSIGSSPTTYSLSQVIQLLLKNGAQPGEANTLAAIAMAESGGNTSAHNPGTAQTPENSWGLWQINLNAHPSMSSSTATDPDKAAIYALQLFRSQGGQPWTTYTNGSYAQFLPSMGPNNGQVPQSGNGANPNDVGFWGTQPPAPTGDITWPTEDQYFGDSSSYYNALGSIASVYADAGMPLPAGAPGFAQAAYAAEQKANDLQPGNDPVAKATAMATLAQMEQQLQQNQALFPYQIANIQQQVQAGYQANARDAATLPLDIQKEQQDIENSKPTGTDSILHTDAGNTGYKDYFSNRTPNPDRATDRDYMAGFNIAKESDQPRQDAISSYLDRVSSELGDAITIRGQNITAAVSEAQDKIDAYKSANTAFTSALPYTIPKGAEFVPGFEPGGLAGSIGLKQQKATVMPFNPFKMATDVVNSTTAPTSIPAPTLPGFSSDPNMFKDALDFYRSML